MLGMPRHLQIVAREENHRRDTTPKKLLLTGGRILYYIYYTIILYYILCYIYSGVLYCIYYGTHDDGRFGNGCFSCRVKYTIYTIVWYIIVHLGILFYSPPDAYAFLREYRTCCTYFQFPLVAKYITY